MGRYIERNEEENINYVHFLRALDKEFVKLTLKSKNDYNYETKFT